MKRTAKAVLSLSLLLALAGCGEDKGMDSREVVELPSVTDGTAQTGDTSEAADNSGVTENNGEAAEAAGNGAAGDTAAGTAAGELSEEKALRCIKNFCYSYNPALKQIEDAGEYPVYWETESSDEKTIVVLFRSYTGAISRYYIDRTTGDTYETVFVPGIHEEEELTGESFNIKEYDPEAARGSADIVLTGLWHTASITQHDDGGMRPEYYVKFVGSVIEYGDLTETGFVTIYKDKIEFMGVNEEGIYRVQATSPQGIGYTYQTSAENPDVLEYYETQDPEQFSETYSAGASLSREN